MSCIAGDRKSEARDNIATKLSAVCLKEKYNTRNEIFPVMQNGKARQASSPGILNRDLFRFRKQYQADKIITAQISISRSF